MSDPFGLDISDSGQENNEPQKEAKVDGIEDKTTAPVPTETVIPIDTTPSNEVMDDDDGESNLGGEEKEKLEIAKHFILSSPPGQINAVIEDFKVLLPPSLMTPAIIESILSQYSSLNGTLVTDANNKENEKQVISSHNQKSASEYFTSSGSSIKVNHTENTFTGNVGTVGEGSGLHSELIVELQKYTKAHFAQGNHGSGVYKVDDGKFVIVIYGSRISLKNFWSGAWYSAWTVNPADGGHISGKLNFKSHYYEEGNVQLNTVKDFSASIPMTAPSIIEYISKAESDYQQHISDIIYSMGSETLKVMRRSRIITKNRFDWNLNAHKLARKFAPPK